MTDRTEQHFTKLRRMYLSAAVNQLYKPEIEIRRAEATIITPVQECFFHAGGSWHGSAYFKILDDAAYFAAMSRQFENFLLTTSFNIYITRAVTSGSLRSEGRIISYSKQLVLAEATAYDDRGREVARGSGTFMPSAKLLNEEVGYL